MENILKKINDLKHDYSHRKPPFGEIGYIIYKSRYARDIDGKREEWHETIARVLRGAVKLGVPYSIEEIERLYDYMFNLKALYSGRSLWQLETETVSKIGNNSLQSCWTFPMDNEISFLKTFNELMLGGGVGFTVEKEFISKLPVVKHVDDIYVDNRIKKEKLLEDYDDFIDFEEFGIMDKFSNLLIIGDSRQGWINLLTHILLSFYHTGKSFAFNTNLIREKGELIKGFGGVSSGDKELISGMLQIIDIFKKAEGKQLSSIEVLDIMCIIASIVVSGNVRRSALLALGDIDDEKFLTCKRWDLGNIPEYRSNVNITVVCNDIDKLPELFWQSYEKNSETIGLFNRNNAINFDRINEKFHDEDSCMVNPCLPAFTHVLCEEKGVCKFGDIKIGDKIWSEDGFVKVTNKWSNGYKEVYIYKTKFGDFYGTTNHKVVSNGRKIEIDKTKAIDRFCGNYINCFESTYIIEKVYIGLFEVFDITVDGKHHTFWNNGFNVSNCAESTINNESCNLSELFLCNFKNKKEFIEAMLLVYKYNKWLTQGKYLYKDIEKKINKNAKIGIGLTGILEKPERIKWLKSAYNILKEYDENFSKKYNLPISKKLTTIKPSGTLSLISGVSAGIHPTYSKFYYRTVRFDFNDNFVTLCKKNGCKIENAIKKVYDDGKGNIKTEYDENKVVVYFPIKSKKNALTRHDVNCFHQMDFVRKLQKDWSDMSISATIYYNKNNLNLIKEYLYSTWNTDFKTVSFLLEEHGFLQAPFIEITEEEYKKARKKFKPILSMDGLNDDNVGLEDNVECEGNSCGIR